MTVELELEDALELIEAESLGPLRDIGLLESALARPRASAFGEDAYPSLMEKAAALFHSLARNHCLVDGNKRLAVAAMEVFLDLNGARCTLNDDELFDLTMATAAGAHDSTAVDKLGAMLRVG